MSKFSDKIKEYRVVSILSLVFVMSLLNDVVQYSLSPTLATNVGVATMITGLSASLVGLVKFIFDFAVKDSSKQNKEK